VANPRGIPFSSARSTFLVRLCHHRWSVETAAEVARAGGCRFVELQHRLEVNSDSLRAALEALFGLGLIRRNPGYGHPLRPEYVPTERGACAGPALDGLLRLLERLEVREIARRKWSLPVLDAAAGGKRRFRELEVSLADITPRALARTVKDLTGAGLLRREVQDGYPPAPIYHLSTSGRQVAQALRRVWERVAPGSGARK